ncbi:ACP phosphodiesterase [Oceanospirillum sanctuarii]|uniref:acyl carrier protein phosphodiesterase n=1 Tax=Oceanospirillum sanctuarii TaxID=1434821 RepID=UPI000A35FE6F|nr:ACP phosphodiesterase [Oceanospirillum sanctuarii]
MNYLAHAFLAREEGEIFRLGNLMADHIKGPVEKALDFLPQDYPEQLAEELIAGIRYHRHIDHTVDHSPFIAELRDKFSGEYRRYAGIVLDMAWDHHLARSWSAYSGQSLSAFAENQYQLLIHYRDLQPDSMQQMVHYMVKNDWLVSYTKAEHIRKSLAGMSQRMRRKNKLAEAFVEIPRLESDLSQKLPLLMDKLLRQALRNPG